MLEIGKFKGFFRLFKFQQLAGKEDEHICYGLYICRGLSHISGISFLVAVSVDFKYPAVYFWIQKAGDYLYRVFCLYRFQISKMRELVHKIDETAFITITEVADVYKANM